MHGSLAFDDYAKSNGFSHSWIEYLQPKFWDRKNALDGVSKGLS